MTTKISVKFSDVVKILMMKAEAVYRSTDEANIELEKTSPDTQCSCRETTMLTCFV